MKKTKRAPGPRKPQPVSRAALSGEADPRLVRMSVSIQDDAALYAAGHPRQPGPRGHAGRPGDRPAGRGPQDPARPRPGAGEFAPGAIRLRPAPRGRAHPRRAAARRARGAGRRLPARRPQPQRPGGPRRAALHRRGLRPRRRGAGAGSCGRSSGRPGATSGRSSPATPTCSGPSRSRSPTTCSPTWRCWAATGSGFAEVRRRAAISPLGSGRAGRHHPEARPRARWRAALGLDGVTRNSLDAVSDRDSAIELCFACALAAVHLSRLGEEIVLWTTREFGFMDARRRLRHRQLAHAAEEELGRGRAGPGPGRHRHRRPGRRCSPS